MEAKTLPVWHGDGAAMNLQDVKQPAYRNLCLLSVVFAFSVGLFVGILIPLVYFRDSPNTIITTSTPTPTPNTVHIPLPMPVQKVITEARDASDAIRTIFVNNSYGVRGASTKDVINEYPTVSFIERHSPIVHGSGDDDVDDELGSLVEGGIYWGRRVEEALPEGYDGTKHAAWANYVSKGIAVKLENGCGRMQNRLVTFQDGSQGCARYRQNTDQIQGELFSFYLAQVLGLENLAPSVVNVVNLRTPLWQNLAHDIASAQWNSNRPIVLTKYIPNLDSATIPSVFKPSERHLNRNDVANMTSSATPSRNGHFLGGLVELAQWSDLIVFDYLTANLDRVVNNLYNYQWNVNIMDAPAHNLARKLDSNLLVFLDNESGLLHGYRLLQKYEIYHSILLDNLCLFRKQTADVVRRLKLDGNVGKLLRDMFEKQNGAKVKDVLPTLPDKSVKILNERIDRVYNQVVKCELLFSNTA